MPTGKGFAYRTGSREQLKPLRVSKQHAAINQEQLSRLEPESSGDGLELNRP